MVSWDRSGDLDQNLLEWRGILPPAHPPRAVDGAHSAAGIAVAAAMGHALSTRIWVYRILEAVGGDRGDGDIGRR